MAILTQPLPSSTDSVSSLAASPLHAPPVPVRLLRLADVMQLTGLRRTTLYSLQARGEFPLRVVISANTVAWVEAEVQQWLAQRSSARSVMSARLPLRIVRPVR